MVNKILKIALALSIGTFTLLQAKSEYERNYNNSTINVQCGNNNLYSDNCIEWFYGTVKIKFNAGIVSSKRGCR